MPSWLQSCLCMPYQKVGHSGSDLRPIRRPKYSVALQAPCMLHSVLEPLCAIAFSCVFCNLECHHIYPGSMPSHSSMHASGDVKWCRNLHRRLLHIEYCCIAVVVFVWLIWLVPPLPFIFIAFLLLFVAFRIIAVNSIPRSIGVIFNRSLSCGVS
jgi:hypothetical protein